MITGLGCNITATDGPDGMLVIDTGEKPGRLDSVLSSFSDHPVKYILHTNFHFDHIGDDELLSNKGATIIAHNNTRDVLASGWKVPEFPNFNVQPKTAEYLPGICFNDTLNLFFNDNSIQAIHYPSAHSVGDAIYFFRNLNLVHVGDLYVTYGFPYIDSTHGGTHAGLIGALDDILKICDDKTMVIPGHGGISDRQGLLEYRDMLVRSRSIISGLVQEGKSLEEIIKLNPIRSLFKERKSPFENMYITLVFNELTKK